MKLTRILALFLCCVIFICALSSCTVLSSTSTEKETVLKVGTYNVPYEQYYYIASSLRAEMPDADDEEVEKEAFEMLCEIYAVFSLAEDFGIDPDDEYIASVADDAALLAIEECGGKKEYKEALSENFMNDSVFRFLKRHSKTADELLSAMISSPKYSKDEEGIKALAKSDEFICVKQVLITSESCAVTEDTYFKAGEEHTDEEALAIAEKVRAKALAGEDFDSLVNEYGESLFMFNNTDGYYVLRGLWDAENEDAVFALEMGEVSEVVKSKNGYSVFLRCEKSDKYIEKNIDTIAEDYYEAQYNMLLEERIAKLTVEKTEAYDSLCTEK